VPTFCKSAYYSGKRQYFVNPPIFLESANIFSNPTDFLKSANISQIRLIFLKAQGIYEFA
jgi:hypothetical protein